MAQISLELVETIPKQVRRRAGEGIDPGDEVVRVSHLHASGRYLHTLGILEPGVAQDDRFAIRAAVSQEALPGARHRAEIASNQLANRLVWRQRVRELVVGAIPRLVSLDVADVDQGATWLEHLEDERRHAVAIHPMEGLGKGRHAEPPESGRQVLSPRTHPGDVPDASIGRAARTFRQHPRVGIETDRFGEEMSERQRHDAWSASHIEQPSLPIERQDPLQRIGEPWRIGRPAAHVVRRATEIERLVPLPAFRG